MYPEGVEVRGKSIRIRFSYRDIRCSETLKGWEVTKQNIKKAGLLRAAILSDINEGKFDYLARFPNSKKAKSFSSPAQSGGEMTISELLQLYEDLKCSKLSSQTKHVMKGMISQCSILVGEVKIKDFTHVSALEVRKVLMDKPSKYGKKRSPKTINGLIKLMARAFAMAKKSDFIESNPFDDVDLVKNKSGEPDPLEHEEVARLISSVKYGQWANMFTVAIYTGLRTGELCALAWEDVDLENGTMRITRNVTVNRTFTTPKTQRSTRTIYLLDPAIEALKSQMKYSYSSPQRNIQVEVKEESEFRQESVRFVFPPIRTGGKIYDTYNAMTYSSVWARSLKTAGIRHRRSYQSRHTYACWMITSGANLSFIAGQMGHVGTSMLEKVYGRFMLSQASSQVEFINKAISQWPTGAPSENAGK